MAAIKAAIGIVSIHANNIFLAIDHLTFLTPLTVPTPIIDPAITCVVLTGMPAAAVPKSTTDEDVSALKPSTGRSFVILVPMVLTIRQPPANVPKAMAACADNMTHNGT